MSLLTARGTGISITDWSHPATYLVNHFWNGRLSPMVCSGRLFDFCTRSWLDSPLQFVGRVFSKRECATSSKSPRHWSRVALVTCQLLSQLPGYQVLDLAPDRSDRILYFQNRLSQSELKARVYPLTRVLPPPLLRFLGYIRAIPLSLKEPLKERNVALVDTNSRYPN